MPEEIKTKNPGADKDATENKVMAALSYVFVLVFIPLLIEKESKFVQFHARQGLVIFLIWIGVLIISSVPVIGWLLSGPLNLAMLVISFIGFVMAIQGKQYRMPLVADLADKMKI